MITDDLITMDATSFVKLLPMFDATACEYQARKMAALLGDVSFDTYHHCMADIVADNAMNHCHDEIAYQILTRQFFTGVSSKSDILERLAALTLLSITLRLEHYLDQRKKS